MVNEHDLTAGALLTMMRGGDYDNAVLQILGCKKLNIGDGGKCRHRMLLSDGRHTIAFAMYTTEENDPAIVKFSVVKIKRFVTSVINNNTPKQATVLLILELALIKSGNDVGIQLGNPTGLTDEEIKASNSSTTTNHAKPNGTAAADSSNSSSNFQMSGSNINLESQIIHPISSLSPYQNKWIIKARVSNKSAVRTWSNSRGEGKLFSMDLIDESGEIRCTAFNNLVDKYFDFLQVDKIYFISKGQLKAANRQYSTLKNDYEMTMTNETVIQECQNDDGIIPQTKYDFVTIDKIGQMEPGAVVDVIGICKEVSDLQVFNAKSTGRELKKKEVSLVDQSNTVVSLTLWGSEAEMFDGTNNPVIVIKGAKVGEFGGGKTLSTLSSSMLKTNPDIQESFVIRGWYDREGSSSNVTNISSRTGMSGSAQWMSFKEVRDQGLGAGDKGDYYQTVGTVLLMRPENVIYKACPTEECNKKVIDMENGMYRCEKCNREYPNFKYRLLALMNVADWSGNQWMSMFSTEAERILGMTAQEVGEALENNSEAVSTITDKANFKRLLFRCRAKMETYNDEAKLKTVAVKVDNINYRDYNTYLINRINQMMN